MTRACQSFTALETKYENFVKKYIDPIVDNYLKVVPAVKRGTPSQAKICSLDFTANEQATCAKLQKAADKIYDKLDTPWKAVGCPFKVPSINFPDLTAIEVV